MEGGGGGGAMAPSPLENYKLSFIAKKKNWYELPSRSKPHPPPGNYTRKPVFRDLI